MKEVYVVSSERDWARVTGSLFTADGNENAGALLCGIADGASETRLLVRCFIPVPQDLYVVRNSYHLEVSPSFYNLVVDECTRQRLSPVIIHSHPFQHDAWYSRSDDFGEARLLPVLQSLLPAGRPASLVVTPQAAVGRSRTGETFAALSGLKILGQQSKILHFAGDSFSSSGSMYDRQVEAIGEAGQAILHALKVGIVGVGGIGSLVVEQLARLGVRDIVMIDNDVVEESNISRLYGAQARDIGKRKVNVASANARKLGGTNINAINQSALSQRALLHLRDRDVIFSCVDNDKARAVLNRFSHQYLVPLIDLGIRLDGRRGEVQGAAGRVVMVGHGMTCLRCSHHINPHRIRVESLPEAERKALAQEGYVMGIDDPAPAVISLNTVISGFGVTAALNAFVHITGGRQPTSQLYDAKSGTVFTAESVHEHGCDICDEDTGLKGLGDQQIVSAYE